MANEFEDLERSMMEEDAKAPTTEQTDDTLRNIEQEGMRENPPPGEPPADSTIEKPAPTGEPAKAPETAQFDWKQFGDNFTDEKSVKEFIEKSKLSSKELEALNGKVKELESRNPFSDEVLFKLDQVKKTNPDKFDMAKSLALGTPDPLDVLKMQLELKNEAFKNASKEDKTAYLRRQYKLSHNHKELSEDDYSDDEVQARKDLIREADEEVRVGKMKLQIDAENAKKELTDALFGGIEVPKMVSEEEQKRQSEESRKQIEGKWDIIMSNLPVKSASVDILNPESKQTSQFLSVDIPQQDASKYKNELRDIMVSSNSSPEGISQEDISSYVEKRYREDHFAEIIHSVVKKASAMGENEIRKVFYNTQKPVNPSDPAPVVGIDEKTTEAEVARALRDF